LWFARHVVHYRHVYVDFGQEIWINGRRGKRNSYAPDRLRDQTISSIAGSVLPVSVLQVHTDQGVQIIRSERRHLIRASTTCWKVKRINIRINTLWIVRIFIKCPKSWIRRCSTINSLARTYTQRCSCLLLQASESDNWDKKAAIIDYIAAGIETLIPIFIGV